MFRLHCRYLGTYFVKKKSLPIFPYSMNKYNQNVEKQKKTGIIF